MCELEAFCRKFYGMNCEKDKNSLKCLIVKIDNGRLMDFQLKKNYLGKMQKISRY